MMTSSSISAHDLLTDHPFPGIQLVAPTADHLDHGGHYCQNWVSHQHRQLDQHNKDHVGSDDGVLNQVMYTEQGIKVWAWEQNDDLYDPWIRSADMDSDDIHDNWVPNSSKLKVVKKMNPKRASKANIAAVVEMRTDDFPYFQPADQNDSSSNNSGSNGNNNNNGIRVCSDCNTTKTPLWRSGPKGAKSLCNACGIRQRKARRALAAAAGSSDNNALTKGTTSSPKSLKIKISNNTKEKKTSTTGASHDDNTQGWQQPYKKRLKQADHNHQSPYTSASHDSNPSSGKDSDDHQCSTPGEPNNNKRICFEEFVTLSLSKNAALHRVFPQDEKEAAILLMALSCGLVHN